MDSPSESTPAGEPLAPQPDDDRDSGLSLQFAVSISYHRQRGRIHDQWEQRVDSLGLMLIGGIVVIVILLIVLPRIMDALSKIP